MLMCIKATETYTLVRQDLPELFGSERTRIGIVIPVSTPVAPLETQLPVTIDRAANQTSVQELGEDPFSFSF